jgi:calcineurin-like phosphoesterase family protein
MTNFYISDTHFDHAKIIELCNRPFANVDEMNETMVRNWNSVVTKDDVVHFLGDFAWKSHAYWIEQLNGKIIFYRGNHDKGLVANEEYIEMQDGEWKLVLFHYPIVSWNGLFRGVFHFYGHVHTDKLLYMPLDWHARSFNVGVEALDYTPRTATEIIMKGNE